MKLTGEGGDEKWQGVKSSFLLLKPKLAYAEGRALSKNRYSKMKELHQLLRKAMDSVKPEEAGARKRFLNFVDFFESILAYHKAFGGKEN
jgi:CRISPR-associated protein Csm2